MPIYWYKYDTVNTARLDINTTAGVFEVDRTLYTVQRLSTVTPELRPQSALRPVIFVPLNLFVYMACFRAYITVRP